MNQVFHSSPSCITRSLTHSLTHQVIRWDISGNDGSLDDAVTVTKQSTPNPADEIIVGSNTSFYRPTRFLDYYFMDAINAVHSLATFS